MDKHILLPLLIVAALLGGCSKGTSTSTAQASAVATDAPAAVASTAASNPLTPRRHSAHSPCSSNGNALRNGARHCTQKYSAAIGSGFARHALHTGTRETCRSGSAQMRQSSGKTREKSPVQNLRTREGAASGETVLMSKLLLKTTPPKTLVYTTGWGRRW